MLHSKACYGCQKPCTYSDLCLTEAQSGSLAREGTPSAKSNLVEDGRAHLSEGTFVKRRK